MESIEVYIGDQQITPAASEDIIASFKGENQANYMRESLSLFGSEASDSSGMLKETQKKAGSRPASPGPLSELRKSRNALNLSKTATARERKDSVHLQTQMSKMDRWAQAVEERSVKLSKANQQLRTALEQTSKECSMQQRKAVGLAEMLLAAKAERDAAEDVRKKLEIKFARSDKGQAMLKCTRLKQELDRSRSDLEQAKNDLSQQESRNVQLEKQVEVLKAALSSSSSKGGRGWQEAVQSAEGQAELVAKSQRCKELELQLKVARQQVQLLQQEAHEQGVAQEQLAFAKAELQNKLDEAETDKTALLDFVQEMQEQKAQEQELAQQHSQESQAALKAVTAALAQLTAECPVPPNKLTRLQPDNEVTASPSKRRRSDQSDRPSQLPGSQGAKDSPSRLQPLPQNQPATQHVQELRDWLSRAQQTTWEAMEERSQLQRECARLTAALADTDRKLHAAQQQSSKHMAKPEELGCSKSLLEPSQHASGDAEVANLQSLVEELRREVAQAQGRASIWEKQVLELQASEHQSASCSECPALREQVSAQQADRKAEQQTMQHGVAALQRELQELQAQLEEAQTKRQEAERHAEGILTKLRAKEAHAEEAEGQVAALQTAVSVVSVQLANAQRQNSLAQLGGDAAGNEQSQHKIASLEAAVSAVREQLKVAEEVPQHSSKEMEGRDSDETAGLRSRIATLESERQSLQKILQEPHDELDSATDCTETNHEAVLCKTVKQLKAKLDRAEHQIKSATAERCTRDAEDQRLTALSSDWRAASESLSQRVAELQSELNGAHLSTEEAFVEKEELAEQLRLAMLECRDLASQRDVAQLRAEEAISQKGSLTCVLQSARAECKTQQSEGDAARQEADRLRGEMKGLAEELRRAEAECHQLQGRLERAQVDQGRLREAWDQQARLDLQQLEAQVQARDVRNQELQIALEDEENSRQSTVAALEVAQTRADELKTKLQISEGVCQELEGALDESQRQQRGLQSSLEAAESRCRQLEADAEAAQEAGRARSAQTRAAMEEAEATVRLLEAREGKTQARGEQAKAALLDAETRLQHLEAGLGFAHTQREQTEFALAEAADRLRESEEARAQSQQLLRLAESKFQKLAAELASTDERCRQSDVALKEAMHRCDQLRDRCKGSELEREQSVSQCQGLEAMVEHAQEECQQLQRELEALHAANADWQKEAEAHRAASKQLRRGAADNDQLAKKLAESEAEQKRLEAALEAAQTHCAQSNAAEERYQSRCMDLEEECLSAQEACQTLQVQVERLHDANTEWQKVAEAHEAESARITNAAAADREHIAQLQQQLQGALRSAEITSSQLSTLEAERNTLRQEKQEIERRAQAAQAALREAEAQVEVQRTTLEAKLGDVKAEALRASEALQEAEQRCLQMQQDLRTAQEALRREELEAERQAEEAVGKLQDALRTADKEIEQLSRDVLAAEARLARMQEEAGAARIESQGLRERLSDAEEGSRALMQTHQKSLGHEQELREQIQALGTTVDELCQDLEASQAEAADLQQRLEELDTNSAVSSGGNDPPDQAAVSAASLQAELREVRAQAEAQREEAVARIDRLKQQLQNAHAELTIAQTQLAAGREANEQLDASIREQEADLLASRFELEDVTEKLHVLRTASDATLLAKEVQVQQLSEKLAQIGLAPSTAAGNETAVPLEGVRGSFSGGAKQRPSQEQVGSSVVPEMQQQAPVARLAPPSNRKLPTHAANATGRDGQAVSGRPRSGSLPIAKWDDLLDSGDEGASSHAATRADTGQEGAAEHPPGDPRSEALVSVTRTESLRERLQGMRQSFKEMRAKYHPPDTLSSAGSSSDGTVRSKGK